VYSSEYNHYEDTFFIAAPSTAALSHKQPASAVIFSNSCGDQVSLKRNEIQKRLLAKASFPQSLYTK